MTISPDELKLCCGASAAGRSPRLASAAAMTSSSLSKRTGLGTKSKAPALTAATALSILTIVFAYRLIKPQK